MKTTTKKIRFVDQVDRELRTRLVSMGFLYRRGALHLKLSEDAWAYLGLSRAVYSDKSVVIGPTVGVRFDSVFELGRKVGYYDSSRNANFNVAMRYLVPGEPGDYVFHPDVDNEPEIRRLLDDVMNFAIPFARSFGDVEHALRVVGSWGRPYLNNGIEFLPLAALLLGDTEAALETARRILSSMDPSRGSGRDYAEFVDKLTLYVQQLGDDATRSN